MIILHFHSHIHFIISYVLHIIYILKPQQGLNNNSALISTLRNIKSEGFILVVVVK